MHQKQNRLAVIFDDHLLFVESFAAMLEQLALFDTVMGFTEEKAYKSYLTKYYHTLTYCFLDYYLPNRNALPVIEETRRINKQSRIIIVSSVTSPAVIDHIRTFLPNGFISKSSSSDIIVECIRHIERSEPYLCPEIRARIPQPDLPPAAIRFTAREIEVLQLFALGLSVAETAEKTNLSKHTIISHRRKLMQKTNSTSITQLLAYARLHELI